MLAVFRLGVDLSPARRQGLLSFHHYRFRGLGEVKVTKMEKSGPKRGYERLKVGCLVVFNTYLGRMAGLQCLPRGMGRAQATPGDSEASSRI